MSKKRILIMDDEELIQDVLSTMLDFLGYEVDIASEGAKAIQMYKNAMTENKRYDVIIMDLTIPGGIGGKEAINDLIDIDSDVNAIVSSGYTNDPVMSNYSEYGFRGVISKPFNIEELEKVLNGIIR